MGGGGGGKAERGRYCKELLTPSRSKIMTSFSRPVFKFQENEKQRIAPNVGCKVNFGLRFSFSVFHLKATLFYEAFLKVHAYF